MRLSRGARRLLEHLKQKYCRNKPVCWPSRPLLAREIRRSESQLYRLLAELVENRLVISTQRGQTSALLELQPRCFQRNWLDYASPARADARADARAARAVLISERSTLKEEERALPSKPVENPYVEEWHRIQRFAAERGLPLNNGADIDAAAVLMESEILRKPPESETIRQAAQVYR